MGKGNILFTVHGDCASWCEKRPKLKKRLVSSKERERNSIENVSNANLERKVRRTRNLLAQTVQSIKNTPTHMMSFIITSYIDEDMYQSICLYCFNRLNKYLCRKFPNAYFVCSLGWSLGEDLHLHILCNFGLAGIGSNEVDDIAMKWAEISGSEDHRAFHICKYDRGRHLGYLTKRAKIKEMYLLKKSLGRKRLWSIVNAKNVKFYQKREFEFTPAEWTVFSRIIRKLAESEEWNITRSTPDQFKELNNCANYIPRELLRLAIKEFSKIKKSKKLRGKA